MSKGKTMIGFGTLLVAFVGVTQSILNVHLRGQLEQATQMIVRLTGDLHRSTADLEMANANTEKGQAMARVAISGWDEATHQRDAARAELRECRAHEVVFRAGFTNTSPNIVWATNAEPAVWFGGTIITNLPGTFIIKEN